jgi:hypothetical protein
MPDYRQMWTDLGMDVEKHDLLCEALPDAFGEVYLSQEHRPEGMNFFYYVVSEIHGVRPAELIEHQKQGGKVFGTFCVYVPDEVIFAAGAIATGLCGGSQFWVPGLSVDQGLGRSAPRPHLSVLPDCRYVHR